VAGVVSTVPAVAHQIGAWYSAACILFLDAAHEGCVGRRTVLADIARRFASVLFVEEWKDRSAEERIWKFCALRALDGVIAMAT